MARHSPIEDAVSAGGVVWRRAAAGDVEVILCHREDGAVWCLPKGTPEAGESMQETALREVAEETGLRVEPGEQLPTIEYWFTRDGTRFHKHVHFWLMRPTGGDVAEHDHEFDRVEWVPVTEAMDRLTYDGERAVVARSAERLAARV